MPDAADEAQQHIEAEQAHALANLKRAHSPAATGKCLYCQEPLRPPARWCGAECRDGWQTLVARRA